MNFPDKDEAKRFFTDVKTALLTTPEVFPHADLDMLFVDRALKLLDGVWKSIQTALPLVDALYEINNEGYIRNADTGEILKPNFSIDYNRELVVIGEKGRELYIDGPHMADVLFKQGAYADDKV